MASTRTSPSHGKVSAVIAHPIFGLSFRLAANHDHTANNTGRLLGMDAAIPLTGTAAAIWYGAERRRHPAAARTTARTTAEPPPIAA